VQCDRALWHSRAQYWTDADGYEILGVTHWTEPQESESVWHPVSEEPEPGVYWVFCPSLDGPHSRIGVYDSGTHFWNDAEGRGIGHLVTHYAVIVYPDPPEEA
jgi:hypothetical protein